MKRFLHRLSTPMTLTLLLAAVALVVASLSLAHTERNSAKSKQDVLLQQSSSSDTQSLARGKAGPVNKRCQTPK